MDGAGQRTSGPASDTARNEWERPPDRPGSNHMRCCRRLAVLAAAVFTAAALAPAAASAATRGFTVYNGSVRPMLVARIDGDFSGGSHPLGSVLEPHHAERWELTYVPLSDREGTVTYTAPNRRGPTDPAFEAHMRIDYFGGTFAYCATDDGQTCLPPRRGSVFPFLPGDTITFLGLIGEQTRATSRTSP
jgi:hypothetical protein